MTGNLRARFLAQLPNALRAEAADAVDLDERLRALVERARGAWPGIAIEPTAFVAYVAERLTVDGPALEQLAALRIDDLFLACACAGADEHALAAFERTYFADVEALFRRTLGDAASARDASQALRMKLFAPSASGPPKIASYAGRGALKGWLRAAAARAAINDATRGGRDVPTDDALFLALPAAGADPELEYARKLYGDAYRRAFAEAIASLSLRDRNLLRYAFLDRLNIDEIGAVYRIHRATAARRLAQAREHLADAVRAAMMGQLGVSSDELASIVRLIESHLDMTLERYFRPSG